MLANKAVRSFIIVCILVSNIGCDQMSKSLVRNSLARDERMLFLDDHVMLTRVENAGAFLSLGDSLSGNVKFILLVFLPMVVLTVAAGLLFMNKDLSKSVFIGTAFVVGGGIGNIYDRFLYGSVTDFLHLNFHLFRTGIFNMADVSIMTGVFTILISFMIKNTKSSTELFQ